MRFGNIPVLSTVFGVILLLLGVLGGAAGMGDGSGKGQDRGGERFTVVCTVMPVWALTQEVTEGIEGVEVSLLLESAGGCPHDYAMTTRDRKRLSQAKLILANGLGLERFLKGDDLPPFVEVASRCRVIDVGGQERQQEQSHQHQHGGENPHVWLSPAEAITMTRAIGDALAGADAGRKEKYAAGVERAVRGLERLRGEVEALAGRLAKRNVIVPAGVFDYLARDLKLEAAATFDTHEGAGLSTRKLREIVGRAKSSGAAAVFCDAGASARVAETIAGETGLPKFELDTLMSCEKFPPVVGWYEAGVRSNLAVVEKALGGK